MLLYIIIYKPYINFLFKTCYKNKFNGFNLIVILRKFEGLKQNSIRNAIYRFFFLRKKGIL